MRIRTLPFCIGSAVSSGVLLGAGWLWAQLVVLGFQRREGVTRLSDLPRGAHYEFWGVSVPSMVTANLLAIVALLSLFMLWRRRDAFSFSVLLAYFVVLAAVWAFLFARLGVQVFDWFD